MTSSAELMVAAARCYLGARLEGDAIRCLATLGQWEEVARLHERAERWDEAATAYARAGEHVGAARCFERGGDVEHAAESWARAGMIEHAAWAYVHRLEQPVRARALLAGAAAVEEGSVEALGRALVRARERAARQRGASGRALVQVMEALGALVPTPERRRLVEWSHALAEVLRRPDLAVRLGALRVGVDGWDVRDAWCETSLGQALRVPGEGGDER